MARSEFRYNKRRKHYSYVFKDMGHYRKNILLSSKPIMKKHGRGKKNIKLYKHPNPNSNKEVYLIPIIFLDSFDAFETKKARWRFDKNDKRKVKRIIHKKK